jgi:hypothetical protein
VRTAGALSCLALALPVSLAACGSSATAPRWHDLRSVRVIIGNDSLPPPFGRPRTASFVTGPQLSRAQAALNSHHITRLAHSTAAGGGCAGGYQVAITIVEHDSRRVTMSAYRCANTTSGDIGGDLPGFLSAVGISPPG